MKSGNNFRKRIFTLMMICVLTILTGCSTYNSFKYTFIDKGTDESENVITIGVLEPTTGKNADNGKQEIKGIELANSIYSTVLGCRVELVEVDTQSSVSATKAAVQGLIEMKPAAIIGCAGEATSLAASEYIEEAGIPAITPSATNPLITVENGYYFRASLTESQMGEGLAEYAYKELGSTQIGEVTVKNDTSAMALLDGFDDKIKDLAGRKKNAVKLSMEINTTDEELAGVIDSIKEKDIEVCFVSLGAAEMDKLLTLAEENNLTDVVFLGTRSWGQDDFVKVMEKHPDIKVVFPYVSVLSDTNSASEDLTEETQRFTIEYANRYGTDDIPTDYAARGYDAYLLILNAIHNAGSTDGAEVREAMHDISNMQCVTGVFSFDERGNVVRSVNLSTITDGAVVSEYVTESESESTDIEKIESALDNPEE